MSTLWLHPQQSTGLEVFADYPRQTGTTRNYFCPLRLHRGDHEDQPNLKSLPLYYMQALYIHHSRETDYNSQQTALHRTWRNYSPHLWATQMCHYRTCERRLLHDRRMQKQEKSLLPVDYERLSRTATEQPNLILMHLPRRGPGYSNYKLQASC